MTDRPHDYPEYWARLAIRPILEEVRKSQGMRLGDALCLTLEQLEPLLVEAFLIGKND